MEKMKVFDILSGQHTICIEMERYNPVSRILERG